MREEEAMLKLPSHAKAELCMTAVAFSAKIIILAVIIRLIWQLLKKRNISMFNVATERKTRVKIAVAIQRHVTSTKEDGSYKDQSRLALSNY